MLHEPVDIDWKDANAASHFAKHKIAFSFAAGVFQDRRRVVRADLRQPHEPPRFNVVGVVDGICLNVTYTMVRTVATIISARPASRNERKAHAENHNG